ncbi:MAG: NAD-dependent epimerase/dehydratase family protein [Balneolaceae bacterium]|nr:NAD-dependent epimerase/dehydratase family protein [Balneolaceae bacterium]
MNVLLTGATGFLGWRTLEALVNDPAIDNIVATGRTLKLTHTVAHKKVTYRLGELENKDFVESLFVNIDAVVNAAALSSPWGDQEVFETANVHTQRNLIEAAKRHEIQRFVYISTPSLYFNFSDRFEVKEDDPLPQTLVNHYAETKRKAELLLMESELPHIILRPRAIIGRGDTVIMPRLIRAVDDGRLKIIGDGKNVVDLTSVANVAQAILLSLKSENESSLNEIYNISNGAPVVLWDAISEVLTRLGRTAPNRKVPYRLVKWVAQFLEFKSRMTNNEEPVLTQYGVGTLAFSLTLDISKAKNLLGYQPTVSTEEAIDEFVNWYQDHEG